MFQFRSRLNEIRQAVTNTVDRAVAAVERVVDRAGDALRSVIPFDTDPGNPDDEEIIRIIEEGLEDLETIQAEETEVLEETRREFETYADDLDNELSAQDEFYADVNNLGGNDEIAEFLWDRQILFLYQAQKFRNRPFAELEDIVNYVNDGSFPLGYVEAIFYDGAFFHIKVSGE